jgi:anaerobic selenocysteine-containing dehydrogenase
MTAVVPRPGTVTIKGACPHDCPDTCALVLTVEDGRLTKVRGDDDHPFTRGGLCVKVTDYHRHVYDPERVLYPMRRTGPKGSGAFARITWDEALAEIRDRFTSITAEYGSEAILPYSYLGQQGVLNGMTVGDAFFNAIGSTVTERTFCDGGAISAYIYTLGPTAAYDPESIVHARYIVLWAINTLSNNLHHWPFIEEAQRNGAKVVVIDPRRHRTAKKADWHLPIKPGTDGALALALANVMVTEDLVDAGYVADHVHGYEAYAEHVRQYTPSGRPPRPASTPRTSAPWPASSPPPSRRWSASGWRSSGCRVAATPCGPSLRCRRWRARSVTSVAACCRCRSGRSR